MKTIIIDDEIKAAKMLQIELEKLFPQIDIIGNFQQPELGIRAIDQLKPELLFLDIEMPKKSGFDVLKSCSFQKMQVIFVTAYSEYALQAIKANALDYILKPIDTDELHSAVKKAQQKIEHQHFDQFQHFLNKLEKDQQHFIKIPSSDQILFFKPEEIIYCKAESNYTYIVSNKQKILVSKTLKYMEELLPKNIFIRIHQSFIINRNHIQAYSKNDGGAVTLSNGDTVRISKNKKNLIL